MELSNWLRNRLVEIAADLGFEGYTFDCYEEQNYTKDLNLKPKHISVVIKKLTANRVFTALVQPYQLLVISEENSLQYAKVILENLSNKYNFTKIVDSDITYNLQINEPSVLNNFNVLGAGLRSLIYVPINIVILEGISDLTSLSIDGESVNFLTANISYGANMDSVQFPNQELATSIKIGGAFNITLTIPSQNTTFINKAIKVMVGDTSQSVISCAVSFTIGNISVSNLTMQINTVDFVSSKTNYPSISIGLVK